MIIMLTLEPFLVLSHSIRHDIIVFLGHAIILYCCSIKDSKEKTLLEIISLILLSAHPSGFVLLSAYFIFLLFNKKISKIIFLSLSTIIILLVSSYIKGILNLNSMSFIMSNATQDLTSINNFFFDLYDYFYKAKYKRHIIELSLFIIYLLTLYDYRKFSKNLKILFYFPFIYFFGFIVILGYFNISYLKFFYYFLLVYFSLYFLEVKNIYNRSLIILTSSMFVIVFFGIFTIFINHNSWKLIDQNYNQISKHISKENLISAPLYYSFIVPEINNNYLPITQIDESGKDKCFAKYQNQNKKLDYILVDTNHQNHIHYGPKIKDYLKDYSLLEKIHIGRIGTQNLNKNGYLYLYKLN